MTGFFARLTPVLHLTRFTIASGGVANVWFVILWTRAIDPERARAAGTLVESALWIELACGTLFATALFAFATAMNDLVDLRRDRALHPERPLSTGRLSVRAATVIAALSGALSLASAAGLGVESLKLAGVSVAAVVFFNIMAKFVPAAGLVMLGLIYALQMLTPNPRLLFVWPVWLAMTHALAVGALSHRLAARRPVLTARNRLFAAAGWVFWSGILLGWNAGEAGFWPKWVHPHAAWFIAPAGALFILLAWKIRTASAPPRARADTLQRLGALWLPVYGMCWMAGQGLLTETTYMGVFTAATLMVMTVLRKIYELVEHPPQWRRI